MYLSIYLLLLQNFSMIALSLVSAVSSVDSTGFSASHLICTTLYRKITNSSAEIPIASPARSLFSTESTLSMHLSITSTEAIHVGFHPSEVQRTTKVLSSSLTAGPTNPVTYVSSLKPFSFSTIYPSNSPSLKQSYTPSKTPFSLPTCSPSVRPSNAKSLPPSATPSLKPLNDPTQCPTVTPSLGPSNAPSPLPTVTPSCRPSITPSLHPTGAPSLGPSHAPSHPPTVTLTLGPSNAPSLPPSIKPSVGPSTAPSLSPTIKPSLGPSNVPSPPPTATPSFGPSTRPSTFPSATPSFKPSEKPSLVPSVSPTNTPSMSPSIYPTKFLTALPTSNPSLNPTISTFTPFKTLSPTTLSTSLSPTLSSISRNNSNQNSNSVSLSSEYLAVCIAVVSALLLWCLVVSACWCFIAKRDSNTKKVETTTFPGLDNSFIMKTYDTNTNRKSIDAVGARTTTSTAAASTEANLGSNTMSDTTAVTVTSVASSTMADFSVASGATLGSSAKSNEASSATVAAVSAGKTILEGDLEWGIAYSEDGRKNTTQTNQSNRSSYCCDHDQSTFTVSNPYYAPSNSRKSTIDTIPPGDPSAALSMGMSTALTSAEYSRDNSISKNISDMFNGTNPYHSLTLSRKPSVDSVEQSTVRSRLRGASSAASIDDCSNQIVITNESTAQDSKPRKVSNPIKFNKNPLTAANATSSGNSSSAKAPVMNFPSALQPKFPPASNVCSSPILADAQVDLTSKPSKQAEATRQGKNPFLVKRGPCEPM